MKDDNYPRILATLVSLALGLCLLTVAAGRERTRPHMSNLSFVESTETKGAPQTGSRKRSSRRKRGTSPSKSSTPTTQTQSTTPQQPALPTSQGPLSQMHYELPIRKPGAGESQARGLLERVDCNGNVATFIVKVGESTLKLHAANFYSVQYRSYTPDVSGDITCGARNPANNVVVTFRPAKDARARFNGDIVAVEFVPKDFELKK